MNIDKRYLWLLSLSLLGTGIAAWLDRSETGTNGSQTAKPLMPEIKTSETLASSIEQTVSIEARPLFRPRLDVPMRDIFQTEAPVAPPASPPVATPTAPLLAQPPPLNIRFLGSFSDPAGNQTLYLSQGETDIEAKVGESLVSGYLIMAANAQAIHLEHPPSGTKVVVPVAPE